MPITSGAYVNPGWHNDTDPYINQTEMNAISDTLQQVPIKNGGTGATTAAAALTNLGAEPIANVKSKGSATTPVYFNSSGVATPITGPLPVTLGGTAGTTIADARKNLRTAGYEETYASGSIGSLTQPVYIYRDSNGRDWFRPVTYTLGKSVPSNAVFTDTTALSSMTGTLGVAHGGTGVTSTSALVTALKAATLATAGGTVGSATTPVYVNNGVITACTNTLKTYTGTSPITVSGTAISHATSGVTAASKGDTSAQTPSWGGTFKALSGTVNATGHLTAFAEHTVKIPNKAMTGATSSADGAVGLVPAPAKGKQSSFLRGDGTWATPTNTTDLASMTGTLAIGKGGTGATSAEQAKINLRAVGVSSSYDEENVGSATRPCYGYRSDNGVLYLNPCTYTLGKSVPSNAVFTDTTYSATNPIMLSGTTFSHNISGVTAGTYGTNSATGLTPTWGGTFLVNGFNVNKEGHISNATSHTVKIPNATATTSAAGLMSSADKTKLNAIGTTAGKTGSTVTVTSGNQINSAVSLAAGLWLVIGWGNINASGDIRVALYNQTAGETILWNDFTSTRGSVHGEASMLLTLSATSSIAAVLTPYANTTGKISITAVRLA